jgi:hypothetical protein
LVGQPFFYKFDGKSTTIQDINLPVIMEQLRTTTPNWLRLLEYLLRNRRSTWGSYSALAALDEKLAYVVTALVCHTRTGFRRCLAFIFTAVVSNVALLMSSLNESDTSGDTDRSNESDSRDLNCLYDDCTSLRMGLTTEMITQHGAIISSNGRSKIKVAQITDQFLVQRPRIKGLLTLYIVRIPSGEMLTARQ